MQIQCLNSQSQTQQPAFIPPSPDAAALGKYGQYPVSMCNGLVQIDIPIYTIKLPFVNVPISISYHASGVKVDEISSVVGLGWVLNAGGVITRSVRGLPDDRFGATGVIHDKEFVTSSFGVNSEDKKDYLWLKYDGERKGIFDSESDIYYYNFCGLSGSFRYDITGNLIQIPLTNNIIEFDQSLNKFKIIGSDGTIYSFTKTETSRQTGNSGSNYPWNNFISSWYLTRIITTDNREIDFIYSEDNTFYKEDYEGHQFIVSKNPANYYRPESKEHVISIQTEKTLRLQGIEFPEGRILFNYAGDRADRRKYRLSDIEIKDYQNKLVRAFSLQHGYFTPTSTVYSAQSTGSYYSNYNYRLMLDELKILDASRFTIGTYRFGYNTTQLLPRYNDYYATGGGPTVKPYYGQDYWGYYNGVSTNRNFLTYYPSLITPNFPADREINPTKAQACILKNITYPTKGYTEFFYESNKNASGENMGGLRISKIISYQPDGSSPNIKTYQYRDILDNLFWNRKNILGSVFTQGQTVYPSTGPSPMMEIFDYYLSQPSLPLTYSGGASVFYGSVTEFEGTAENNIGKTEYSFNYNGHDGHYEPPYPSSPIGFNKFEYFFVDRSWARGYPCQVDVYAKKNDDNSFTKVKRTIHSYTVYNAQKVKVGFKAFSNFNTSDRPLPFPYNGRMNVDELFQYTNIIAETGLVKLTKSIETSYAGQDSVIKTITHFYRRLNNQYEVTSTYQSNSNGSVSKRYFKYPKDIDLLIYRNMHERNMLSTVIVTTDSLDNKFLEETNTMYSSWHNSFIAPLGLKVKQATGDYETRMIYHSYDSYGNPTCVSYADGPKIVYIWGYNGQYPVAKIETNSNSESIYNTISNLIGSGTISMLNGTPSDTQIQSVFTNLRNNDNVSGYLITTYTYKPLIGMTSETDPSGRTIFFTYDDFGRLKCVKDEDGKIIKEHRYSYAF